MQIHLLLTPRRPQQVYLAINKLGRRRPLSTDVRQYLHRTAKAIGELNVQQAQLKASLEGYIAKDEENNRSRKRRRVMPDPNTRFVSIGHAMALADSAASISDREMEGEEEEENIPIL